MKKIDAVKMVRKIRDNQGKAIDGKSTQDVISYFRKKAGWIAEKAGTLELKEH